MSTLILLPGGSHQHYASLNVKGHYWMGDSTAFHILAIWEKVMPRDIALLTLSSMRSVAHNINITSQQHSKYLVKLAGNSLSFQNKGTGLEFGVTKPQ